MSNNIFKIYETIDETRKNELKYCLRNIFSELLSATSKLPETILTENIRQEFLSHGFVVSVDYVLHGTAIEISIGGLREMAEIDPCAFAQITHFLDKYYPGIHLTGLFWFDLGCKEMGLEFSTTSGYISECGRKKRVDNMETFFSLRKFLKDFATNYDSYLSNNDVADEPNDSKGAWQGFTTFVKLNFDIADFVAEE